MIWCYIGTPPCCQWPADGKPGLLAGLLLLVLQCLALAWWVVPGLPGANHGASLKPSGFSRMHSIWWHQWECSAGGGIHSPGLVKPHGRLPGCAVLLSAGGTPPRGGGVLGLTWHGPLQAQRLPSCAGLGGPMCHSPGSRMPSGILP